MIKGEDTERQGIEQQNSSHQAVQGEFLNQTNHKYALCLQEVNPTIKFLPQVDVEASEPKIVSIDRVKVKSGLIIIDNPSGGEPGQKEYLVKSKRIWNKSKSQVAPRMLSHEHELRWWQPKASGERTVGGFLTSRDFANLKSMNAFVEDWKKGISFDLLTIS